MDDLERLRRFAYEQHRAIGALRRMYGAGIEWCDTGAEELWDFGESDEGWELIGGDESEAKS